MAKKLNIVIHSSTFLPNVGGLENIMAGIADGLQNLANNIVVFTSTSSIQQDAYSYTVVRNFSLWQLWKAVHKADLLIEANISLKTAVVGLLQKKKWVVVHHLPYTHVQTIPAKIKNWLTKCCHNISVSQYVATTLKGVSAVVPNFYDDAIFKIYPSIPKKKQFVFVGRLVSDKGVLLLIEAIAELKSKAYGIHVDIIGDGNEKQQLQNAIASNNIEKQVQLLGILKGEALAKKLNEYQYIIIPSLWEEPFGIVALEGMACGCIPIYANAGGLPEAVGEIGVPFERANMQSLANSLLTTSVAYNKHSINFIQQHVLQFNKSTIIQLYNNHLQTIVN